MMFDGINLLAVAVAGVASFIFGSIWYGVLGKAWMAAASLTEEQTRPDPVTLGLAFVCQLVMAFVFAGVIYHTGQTSIRAGLISALMIWVEHCHDNADHQPPLPGQALEPYAHRWRSLAWRSDCPGCGDRLVRLLKPTLRGARPGSGQPQDLYQPS